MKAKRVVVVGAWLLGSGLLLTGAYVVIVPAYTGCSHGVSTTGQQAMSLREAAVRWRASREGQGCPTLEALVQDGEISSSTRDLNDPWGHPFHLRCLEEDEVEVSSDGKDGTPGTSDDVIVPKR